uniref:Putative polya-specific ribonuclease parn-like domain-containing protein 1 n=1 Tax=Amblyomma aureolatum TaxID=187763 RepID=A0A1E1XC80_9ACAR
MTEVTACNFESLAPEIEAAIAGASFVAIDTEFTGLVRGPDATPSLFDSIEERYSKLRQTVTSYYVCQLGLCTFTQVPGENAYTAKAFTVYLCPRAFGSVDPEFSVQASCVEFLCQNGFDFNKCFYRGVPYANRAFRRALDAYLLNEQYLEKPGVAKLYDSVRHWLNNNDRSKGDGDNTLTLTPPDGLSIPLLIVDLRTRFPGLDFDVRPEGLKLTLPLDCAPTKVGAEGRAPTEAELGDAVLGFSRCFEALVSSGKPIVGHNMLLDLLMLYNQFCEPLPPSFAKLKAALSAVFPLVYDTKHMSLQIRQSSKWMKGVLSGADLFSLHKALAEVLVPYAPIIKGTPSGLRAHEAGSDAYAAGFVFIKLAHILAHLALEPTHPLSWRHHQNAVQAYANRVNLIRAQYHHIYLGGGLDRTVESRPPLLCIRSAERSQAELQAVLARCGMVDVRCLSRHCMLVAVGNFACARDIVEAFRDDPSVKVIKYSPYKHDAVTRAWLWTAALCGLALSAGCALKLASYHLPILR